MSTTKKTSGSAEAPLLDLALLETPSRRTEWVTLPGLGRVCVRELTMAEGIQAMDYATRPPEDPRGGMDTQEAALWQIALACYDGEGEDARPIFPAPKAHLIRNLKMEQFMLLMQAIQRVNGKDAATGELLDGFFGAGPAGSS